MGYYGGNGAVTSGGSSPSLMAAGWDAGGEYKAYQKIDSTVTRKAGVSLAAAQAEKGDVNMNSHQWPGGLLTAACKGTRRQVSYSQIGSSNLYELTITDEVIQVKLNSGSWQS